MHGKKMNAHVRQCNLFFSLILIRQLSTNNNKLQLNRKRLLEIARKLFGLSSVKLSWVILWCLCVFLLFLCLFLMLIVLRHICFEWKFVWLALVISSFVLWKKIDSLNAFNSSQHWWLIWDRMRTKGTLIITVTNYIQRNFISLTSMQ